MFFPALITAQGRNNLWMSGYDSGAGTGFGGTNIDFNFPAPLIYQQNRPMNISFTFSSITGINGNLLFYSNGCHIANQNNDTLLNGNDFNTGSLTWANCSYGVPINQGVLIIPAPDDTDKYYLFSLSAEPVTNSIQPPHLACTLIDMTLDSGLGAALWKDSIVIDDTLAMGMLTACKHANGRDWWITIPEYQSNCYYSLLLTPSGTSSPVKQCLNQSTGDFDWSGQSVFSPDGTKYARYDKDNGLMIFDFDRCNGIFSNPLNLFINDSAQCGGVAFSPNSQYLYVSSWLHIYQFDMLATNVLASQTTVAVWDTFYSPHPPLATTFYLAQLAPDGKIYLTSNNGTNALHKINSPDNPGLACDVQQHSVLLPTYNVSTIPNHPHYFLAAKAGSICDSLGVGLNENGSASHQIIVYPNPVKNQLFIQTQSTAKNTFTLLTVFGQQLFNIKSNTSTTQIDFSKYESGIYYLKIQNKETTLTEKIIKQ